MSGWMNLCDVENGSLVDELPTVQLQSCYRGSSNRSSSKDDRKIFIPSKMSSPSVFARVEQWQKFASFWVNPMHPIVFDIVATLAAKSKVFQGIGATE